jgi:hypothetical protein
LDICYLLIYLYLKGVIEFVRAGNVMRITLLPSLHDINLILSGVDCPATNAQGQFLPFGREAKFFTEHYLLNRDVEVILEGKFHFLNNNKLINNRS